MSVQVSTRIDETTKQQFDKVCEVIGISPSNAISMFIRGVINHRGIPFNVTMPANTARPPFEFGCMKGKIQETNSHDWFEPMDDFREYM
ncbi:MAG: type II toxin-antitoxin system RelB/DinJ family antitoxin [Oscillospiraceae bacterium]|nr:type II toxin-antitoxin system RelB/DinJ family antitoxin [Oscillospiraceae bacterium]